MSDDEYYSENPNSESDTSDNEEVTSLLKKPLFKPSININSINGSSYNNNDGFDPDDTDEEDEIQAGGDDDDDDDDDLIQKVKKVDDVEEEDDADIEEDNDSDIELDEDGEPIQKTISQKLEKKAKKSQLIIQDDEDDEDDEYDDNYLQKFDNDIMKNYINEFHPECLNHNYDEISKLSVVVRNCDNIIIDPLHRTIPYLTKYERARILGQRAKQIETGAKPLVKIPENIVDSYIIAELELKEKKIPFIIRRPIPGGACEYWSLKDLEVIAF
jgi:DNA-directed RNA polymerase I, II, and III subunit RPABC2